MLASNASSSCLAPLRAASILVVLTTMLAGSFCAAASVETSRSIAGVWRNMAPSGLLKPDDGGLIPLAAATKLLAPEALMNDRPPSAADIKARCAPHGVPRVWLQPYPFQIIEQPGVIAFVYEDRQSYRLIYMDEPLPDPQTADPWFFGHSVGHWEGDTLVVQSVAFNLDTRLDNVLPHSDQLKVTERLRKIDGGRSLELRLTIEDAKTFTRPWSTHLVFASQPQERIAEYVCGIGVFSTRGQR